MSFEFWRKYWSNCKSAHATIANEHPILGILLFRFDKYFEDPTRILWKLLLIDVPSPFLDSILTPLFLFNFLHPRASFSISDIIFRFFAMAGIGPISQDWEPVVIRKKTPNAAAKKDEKAVNAARRSGAEIETVKKCMIFLSLSLSFVRLY